MADKLYSKYFYKKDSILNKNEIWKLIKQDPIYDGKLMSRKSYDEWLTEQEDVQVNKVNNKPVLQHTISAPPNSYQIDLMFMDSYETINKGYSAIINFVEITTKRAYSYPLKSKTSNEVFDIFIKFMHDAEEVDAIEIDKGTEFSKVIKYCNDHSIHTYIYNNDKNSMSIVERFNRSLRNYINKICKKKYGTKS